ncbi:aminodeoxychorismate synthase component I [Pseudonocardiaceae bacterium YIM PH 21723]|nr:aminodeoxychorismate synthase component I [Pseudonocardiaceae bacterium YIM PH 21723]
MRVEARRLPGGATPEQVLRRLNHAGMRPAALIGDWFGGCAIIAPDVDITARPADFTQPPIDDAPPGAVGGGWIGYLGFPSERRILPDQAWGWADHVLRQDESGQWWFESLGEQPEARFRQYTDLLLGADPAPVAWHIENLTEPDERAHLEAVAGCVEQIARGEIFQANICTRFDWDFHGDPLQLFATASARLKPARAAYVAGDWGAVASLSPELFLARHGRRVISSPIKGTLPRRGPEDDGNARLLRGSVKDVAENVMIVDLVRNDLGRICVTGSVTTPLLLAVEPHPGVWHLVSTVEGNLPESATDADLLAATFPPGSVTGAPKIRALEIINELEAAGREVYCGAVGMASPVAGLELNVAIRTLEYHCGHMWLGVGGGITADSEPHLEWQECLTKAAPLLSLVRRREQARSSSAAG